MRSSDDLAKLLQLARVPIFDLDLDGKLLSGWSRKEEGRPFDAGS